MTRPELQEKAVHWLAANGLKPDAPVQRQEYPVGFVNNIYERLEAAEQNAAEAYRLLDHGRKWLSYGGRARWELEVADFLQRVTPNDKLCREQGGKDSDDK